MEVTTVGIDLAKNVFRVHGCDAKGRTVFSKQLMRRQLPGFLANLPRRTGRTGTFSNLRGCQAPFEALSLMRRKCADFHRGPGQTSHAPLKEAEYMTANGLSLIGLNQQPCAWGAVHI